MKRAYRTHHHTLCPTCGRRFIAYHGKKYCSRRCYLNSQLFPRAGVTVKDVRGCWGMTIKDAARALGVSYPQLCRKLKKMPELRDLFPNQGQGRWLAERGYA